MSLVRFAVRLVVSASMVGLVACAGADHAMRLAAAPELAAYDPAPPVDRQYVAIRGAKIPPKTRDGRTWGDLGTMPDPYFKLLVNGAELFRTIPQSKTVNPTWPDAPRGNFPIKVGDEIRVEVWDDSAFSDRPIGVKALTFTGDNLGTDAKIDLDGGGEVHLDVSPALPVWGVGLSYALRGTSVVVTNVLEASPASRAGVKTGDDILRLGGKRVSHLSDDDVIRILGHVPPDGLKVTFAHADGSTLEARLADGPIYALFTDMGDPFKVCR